MPRTLPIAVDASPHVKTLAELGTLVRSARARARLRIDDAAQLAGVSADLLSRLEHGKPVTADKLLAVLSSLGLTMLLVDAVEAQQMVRSASGGKSE